MFPVSFFLPFSCCDFSNRIFPFFARPNTNDFLDWSNEDLPVADLSLPRAVGDHFNDLRRFVVGNQNLNLHLGQKIHRILGAAIKLRVSFLPTEAFDFLDSHALYSSFGSGLLYLIPLERLNNRFNQLHKHLFSSDYWPEKICLPPLATHMP